MLLSAWNPLWLPLNQTFIDSVLFTFFPFELCVAGVSYALEALFRHVDRHFNE